MQGESSSYQVTVRTSSNYSQSMKPPTNEDIELISLKSMEFNKHPTIRALMKTNNTDYLVVGIVGGPGVGKSTILNHLCDLQGSEQGTTSPFKVADLESLRLNKHVTNSIDLRMSGKRIIGLDTQPMFAASVLLKLLTHVSPSMELARGLSVAASQGARPSQASAEALYNILSIQITTFLLCVCHVVLFVMDGPADERVLQLWEVSELFAVMIRSSLSDCRLTDNKEMDLARGVVVCGNCKPDQLTTKEINKHRNNIAQLVTFSKQFQSSPEFDSVYFLAPMETYEEACSLLSPNKEVLHGLRKRMLGLKENLKNELVESEWLKRCQIVWETIWKSKEIGEHFFDLQETIYKGGTGL